MKKKHKAEIANIIRCLITATFLIGISFYLRELYFKSKVTPSCSKVDAGMMEKAKQFMPDFDYAVCLDSMQIVWVTGDIESVSGYSMNEVLEMKSFEFVDERFGKGKYLLDFLRRISEGAGEFSDVILTKDKKYVLFKVHYQTFSYKNEGYMVGKVIDIVEITDEEAAEYYSE